MTTLGTWLRATAACTLLAAAPGAQTAEAPAGAAPASSTNTAGAIGSAAVDGAPVDAPPAVVTNAGGQRVYPAGTIADDPQALLEFSLASRAPADLFERIVVMGASVSYGHGLARQVGKPTGFAEVLDAALLGEHGEVHSHADWFLFSRSLAAREAMVRRALEREPTLLVAPDFLFWYAYGQVSEEAVRPWMFGRALDLLDEFPGTIVVGDLPWLERSVGRTDGRLPGLQPYQLPPRETVDALNKQLAVWAYERPHVVVLPLASFVRRLVEGEAVEVADSRWEAGGPERLLQTDWLHPTLEGAAALAVLCLEQLRDGRPGWDAEHVERDVADVVTRVLGEG